MPDFRDSLGSSFACSRRPGGPHHLSHFHMYYQDYEGVFGIEPIELLAGSIPRRQQRLVEASAELHQAELKVDWDRLQGGQPPEPIDPLR